MTAPYFDDGKGIRLYHGDAREITEWLDADAMLVDPPYGVDYKTNRPRADETKLRRSIKGDKDTAVRDEILAMWGTSKPAIVFGSWTKPRPAGTHTLLIWDTLGALGMGNTPSGDVRHRLWLAGPPGQRRLLRPARPVDREERASASPREARPAAAIPPREGPPRLDHRRPHLRVRVPAARLAGLAAIGVEREESDCELVARRLTLGNEAVKRGWDADVLDLDLLGEAS